MAQNISLWGANYSNVPSVVLPKQGGGTARFTDVTPTTATDSDVLSSKVYFKADGSQSTGTAVKPQGTKSITQNGIGIDVEAYATADVSVPNTFTATIYGDGNASYSYVSYNDEKYYSNGDTFTFHAGDTLHAVSATINENGKEAGTGSCDFTLPNMDVDIELFYEGTYATSTVDYWHPFYPNLEYRSGVVPTTTNQVITPSSGYDALSGVMVQGDANLVAGNIKSGVSIFNVTGTYTGGGGGGGGLDLIQTTSLGTLSISSTSATDTGKSVTCASSTNWDDYDLLIVDVSVDTKTNGRHTSTVSLVLLTGTSNVNTKNTYTVGSNKWNSKLGSTGTASTRQSTTAYGVYVNSASVSSSTLTMPLYYRYNSNSTGTLNGTYTARVYGVKLIDLIGG